MVLRLTHRRVAILDIVGRFRILYLQKAQAGLERAPPISASVATGQAHETRHHDAGLSLGARIKGRKAVSVPQRPISTPLAHLANYARRWWGREGAQLTGWCYAY
jgi:hypothetical protein